MYFINEVKPYFRVHCITSVHFLLKYIKITLRKLNYIKHKHSLIVKQRNMNFRNIPLKIEAYNFIQKKGRKDFKKQINAFKNLFFFLQKTQLYKTHPRPLNLSLKLLPFQVQNFLLCSLPLFFAEYFKQKISFLKNLSHIHVSELLFFSEDVP